MKLAAQTKKTPDDPPSDPPSAHHDGGLFFRAMCKAAKIERKELMYDLRVSKTLVDGWFSGEKNDPFTQARNAVAVFLGNRREDLLPAILMYIAGASQFDGAVLDRVTQLIKGEPS